MMSLFLMTSIKHAYLKNHTHILFAVLYPLTFFLANFGPSSTTFTLPAEGSAGASTGNAAGAGAGHASKK